MNTPIGATINIEALLSFFELGYGENFVGTDRFKADYIDLSDTVVVLGNPNNISAAALLRASRVTAMSTHPDQSTYGPRFVNLLGLIEEIAEKDADAWTTINASNAAMVGLAKVARLRKIDDIKELELRLKKFGELDSHTITVTDTGLTLAKNNSLSHPSTYVQHAWAWK